MTITYHKAFDQGSDEWHGARRGLITASQMKHILTPTLKVAKNDKTRALAYELAAQRITGYTEPGYIGDDILRGWEDEAYARDLYSEHYDLVTEVGFITNDKWGFSVGYSPDGLVGDDGLWETKSRAQKFQTEVIATLEVPQDHVLQLQTGLLVTDRKWIDYTSYCGGMHMVTMRVLPDPIVQAAIISATADFEASIQQVMLDYRHNVGNKANRMIMTERRIDLNLTDGEYE